MTAPQASLAELQQSVIAIVKEHGLEHRAEPFRLTSGELSHDYMDGKKALARGDDLRQACLAIIALAKDEGAEFDAVGGMTLGADSFSHGIAVLTGAPWFVVRKQTKEHGTTRRIEGAALAPGTRVLLIDDVATTGGSILAALEAVQAVGATVSLAVTLVDRGEQAAPKFAELGVRYRPLLTYRDLGIEPVGKTAATKA
ncbi:MAG: orotate phosphoribosyltransferase [Actinomycetes bacterium]